VAKIANLVMIIKGKPPLFEQKRGNEYVQNAGKTKVFFIIDFKSENNSKSLRFYFFRASKANTIGMLFLRCFILNFFGSNSALCLKQL